MRRCMRHDEEQGFALIGLVVVIFIILLALGVAAPRVAKELRRDREVEAMHRGDQYVRAVQLYYRKLGHYPASIEQLEKTNNIRFLRQKYVDPMTGKSDWRLIHVGEAKTTVKGFFGQALTGVAPGLGSAAGLASPGGIGAGAAGSPAAGSSGFGASAFGASSGTGFGSSSPGFGSSSPAAGAGAAGATGTAAGTGAGTSGTGAGAAGLGTGSSTTGTGSGIGTTLAGAFVGVGSAATGDSILELNEQTSYETWEFIYDPRIEQLKAAANLFGNGNSTGLGSATGNASPGLGGQSPSGFGSSPSGFGSSPGGFGSSSPAGSTTPATGAGTGTRP